MSNIFDLFKKIEKKEEALPVTHLVVGLGNMNLTPDSVGPRTADSVNATMHLAVCEPNLFRSLECLEIAVVVPGVMSTSGVEAAEVVSSLCDRIEPDAVIAVDSIASRSPERLGRTVQISNTGIFPGSGIGNRRQPLSEKTLGVPVIAIGVPTVINARAFSSENDRLQKENDLFVSPRDIDTVVSVSAKIISRSINQAFGIF